VEELNSCQKVKPIKKDSIPISLNYFKKDEVESLIKLAFV